MFDPDEKKFQQALRRITFQQDQRGRGVCPNEENLANYLGASLTGEAKALIEAHLGRCSFCMDEITAAFRAEQISITLNVPAHLVDRVKDLVAGTGTEPNVLEVVVRWLKDSIELVRTTGQWIAPLTPVPAGVRGRAQSSDTGVLQVEKQLGEFRLGVEIERVESDTCQVAVQLVGKEGKLANNLRVSLFSGGREQASYLTKKGEAVFERIPRGVYDLKISDSGIPIGVVKLAME